MSFFSIMHRSRVIVAVAIIIPTALIVLVGLVFLSGDIRSSLTPPSSSLRLSKMDLPSATTSIVVPYGKLTSHRLDLCKETNHGLEIFECKSPDSTISYTYVAAPCALYDDCYIHYKRFFEARGNSSNPIERDTQEIEADLALHFLSVPNATLNYYAFTSPQTITIMPQLADGTTFVRVVTRQGILQFTQRFPSSGAAASFAANLMLTPD